MINIILPKASQNSDSPYHFTANMLIILLIDCNQCAAQACKQVEDADEQIIGSPIEYDRDGNDASSRYNVTPIMDYDIASYNLERHQRGFENEEVIPRRHTKGFVNVAAGKSYERRRYGQICDQFCHA